MNRFGLFAGPLAIGLLASSCSFPPPGVVVGRITDLRISGYIGLNQPIRIVAKATFPGSVEHPSLTTVLYGQPGDTIRVMATASRAQHYLGLGIFPVDDTSPNAVEVETTIAVSSPGDYVIVGMQDGAVTATSSLRI